MAALLKVADRRARLLGLDAPKQVEVADLRDQGETHREIALLLSQLAAGQPPGPGHPEGMPQ